MVLFTAASFLYLCASAALLVRASPRPEAAAITAAPIIPRASKDIRNELAYRDLLHYQAHALALRQTSKPGMSVCFGTGSICSLSLGLNCKAGEDIQEWYKCQCTSGRVATNAACQACQDFYGLGGSFSIEDWKGYCAERKFEIAPVPASIVSSWSVFNATMTANTARETGAGTNTVNSAKASTTSSRVTAVTFSDTTLILPTVTFANKQSTVTGTITFLGDPTGSFVPGPLTTTTGMAPLQNAPAGSGANTALAGEIVKMLSIGFATFSLMAAVVVVL